MPSQNLIAFIQNLVPIPLSKIDEIVSHFQPIQFSKNEFLLQEGTVSDRYLFLDDGFMRAFTLDLDGNEVTTGFYSAGQVVFEVASFFQKTPSRESIQALEDCEGWYLMYNELNLLFHTIPEFRDFGRMVLVKGFSSFKERTLSMINESAEQRYETLMRTRPEIFQHAQLKQVASYLGITDTSLSRIRKELSRK